MPSEAYLKRLLSQLSVGQARLHAHAARVDQRLDRLAENLERQAEAPGLKSGARHRGFGILYTALLFGEYGSAAVAQTLYRETEASKELRREAAEERKLLGPIAWNTLVATTASSRLTLNCFNALPSVRSLSPFEYTSAVSKKLMPWSSARRTISKLASCGSIQSASLPKLMHPRQMRDTRSPEEPSRM